MFGQRSFRSSKRCLGVLATSCSNLDNTAFCDAIAMVACRCLRLSLLLLPLFGLVSAFGPRLEPCGRIVAKHLQMSLSQSGSDQDGGGLDKQSHSRRFALHYESRFEEVNGEIFQSRLFNPEPFMFDSSSFGIINPFDDFALMDANTFSNSYDEYEDDLLSCGGDDCVDCSIPEEYRHVENPIDVLAYLGLRRAEPLQAPTFDTSIRDWE
jgi:hypothetical protein